jgi:transmembrane sensor
MARHDSKPKQNSQILAEATDWLIELSSDEADAEVRQQFDAWLRTSPEHLRAYLELLPVWEDGASLGSLTPDELLALGREPENNLVVLQKSREDQGRREGLGNVERVGEVPRPRRHIGFAVAASILAAAAGLSWLYTQRGTYTTDIGEQRSLALEDGSTVNLNAHSRLRVRFTNTERDIELLDGQALFQVAKDSARPFVVRTDSTRIRALGTQFDVNRRRRGTIVTVVEGTVAVLSSTSQASPGHAAGTNTTPPSRPDLLLTAGEQVTVSGASASRTTRANVATATAWTQRRLVFDASTLGEVVDEFNRYNTRQLVLRDPALESFPITAAFSSPDPTSLVRFLESQPTLAVVTTSDAIEISARP